MPQAYEISPKLGHDAKLRLSTHSSKFLGYSAPYCDEQLYFETIDQALDNYLAEQEDNDTWYSFHEFEEVED